MKNQINLYNRQQVYQLDRFAMQKDDQSSQQLMAKAAMAVWNAIQSRWQDVTHIVILAGCGNNGGDAFAVASLAKKAGIEVDLIALGDLSLQSDESRYFRKNWEKAGGITELWKGYCPDCDLIIDGLLGIGLSRDLGEDWLLMIDVINNMDVPRVSIDIPSGLNADTGMAMPMAIKADLTVSFIARKIGCYLADGPDYCAEMVFDDLGLSKSSANLVQANFQLVGQQTIKLPATRKNNSYKNQYGHVLIVGGGRSMSGAALLAAMAALRSGSGLVSLSVHPDNYTVAAGAYAELMVSTWNELDNLLELATVIVVGPGLGQSEQARQLLKKLSKVNKPMVIDADALQPEFMNSLSSEGCVITPHPGEASRLLGNTTQQVQQDRVSALQQLNNKWPVVSVLKGAGTLTGSHDLPIKLCSHGHAGMATAGMGDVLSGIIGGYLAQGMTPLEAAETAVLVHALAAEHFAQEHDEASLIASDVINRISLVVKEMRNPENF